MQFALKVSRSRNKIIRNTWNLNVDFVFQVFPSHQDRKTNSLVHCLGDLGQCCFNIYWPLYSHPIFFIEYLTQNFMSSLVTWDVVILVKYKIGWVFFRVVADFVVSSSACSTKVILTVIPRDGLLSEAKIIRYFGRMGSHYGDFRPHALKLNNCNYSNQKHGVMFEIRFHAWQNLQGVSYWNVLK